MSNPDSYIQPPTIGHVINYNVDMDKPPEKRWLEIVDEYKDDIINLLSEFEKAIDEKMWGRKTIENLISINSTLWTFDNYQEVSALAKLLKISYARTLMLQAYYELFTDGTSLILNRPYYEGENTLDFQETIENKNPCPIHLRTIDTRFPMMAKMIINVNFRSDNKQVCRTTSWPGYLGILTGTVHDVGSVTYLSRYMDNEPEKYLWRLTRNYTPIGFYIKNAILTQCPSSFFVLKSKLRKGHPFAPSYISVCGTEMNSGYVIFRQPELTHEQIFPFNNNPNKGDNYVPVLVQANTDNSTIDTVDDEPILTESVVNPNKPNTMHSIERTDLATYKGYEFYNMMKSEIPSRCIGMNYFNPYITSFLTFPILNERTASVVWMESKRCVHYSVSVKLTGPTNPN